MKTGRSFFVLSYKLLGAHFTFLPQRVICFENRCLPRPSRRLIFVVLSASSPPELRWSLCRARPGECTG